MEHLLTIIIIIVLLASMAAVVRYYKQIGSPGNWTMLTTAGVLIVAIYSLQWLDLEVSAAGVQAKKAIAEIQADQSQLRESLERITKIVEKLDEKPARYASGKTPKVPRDSTVVRLQRELDSLKRSLD